ncbi:hypothetical protein Pla123a_26420 [Posidoniimonas polymericola]|uniref:Uncharacterized protein n=1 Tax=Posidoniimonas polymericola TaxID=2528002 RepID=A0A5C5YM75_9BACT|nr:hypothetical protein [Posidoniimonas polymericola]TWT75858.1 hypothetical protein Pla123a_26420 [Posidoniimonas polymericola]
MPAIDHNPNDQGYRLSVNSYDRGASLLIALLVMVGVGVGALVIIWYANHLNRRNVPPFLLPVNPASRPADAAMGLKEDIEPPGVEDAPELTEPQLQDTLTALSDLSSKSALLADDAIDSDSEAGKGSGFGDSRQAGMGGDGPPVNEPQREIRFEPADRSEYARFLDFWKVELAVLDQRNNMVYYASNFTGGSPQVRNADPSKNPENRVSFISNGTAFEALDRNLVTQAGIAGRGNIIIQFWPNESAGFLLGLENQEMQKAGKTSLDQVQRTVFRVVRDGAEFSWELEEQLYY